MNLFAKSIDSPIGTLTIVATSGALTGIYMQEHKNKPEQSWLDGSELRVILEVERQLAEYFDGSRVAFDLPILTEGTEFQSSVWQQLTGIPYGETRSYGQIAVALGRDKAFRAVGTANGRNRISVVIPCHRVVGSDGTLTGYAGGVERKKWLLEHERRVLKSRTANGSV